MSGWDTSAKPIWDPQDGPEDRTQSFPASDMPPEDSPEGIYDSWSLPASPLTDPGRDARQPADDQDRDGFAPASDLSGPPPEFFVQDFQKRTPGATLARRDLPARDLPARDLPARDLPARNVPPWEEHAREEPGRPEPARDVRQDSEAQEQELRRQYLALRDAGRADSPAGPEQTEQTQQSPVAALSPDALDREYAARLDPALQDFFASSGSSRTDPPSPARVQPPRGIILPHRAALQAPERQEPGLSDPARPDRDQQRNAEKGDGEQGSRYNDSNSGTSNNGSPWDGPAKRSMTGPLAVAMTGPMLAVKSAASLVTPKEDESLLTKALRFIGVGIVVIAAIVAGTYLLTHSSGGSPNATVTQPANPQPNLGGGSTAKATAKAKATSKTKKKKSTAARYVLSTPATAGGYPRGQDPQFLTTATSTARSILAAVLLGGGGTVKGSAVSASYKLPTHSQVITFVGYKGTFNPAKVIARMGSYGTTDGTYSDAKAGDSIACANTTSSPSGAVCVWVTKTTIGITEFFSSSGPETLTASQYKGAADAEKLRASVEKKKS